MSFSRSCASGELVSLTLLNFQIIALNPQMRSFLDSNSQLREMMQNPEVLRQLTSPDTMQVHIKVFQLLTQSLHILSLSLSLDTLTPTHMHAQWRLPIHSHIHIFICSCIDINL